MKVQMRPAVIQSARQKLLRWSGRRGVELGLRTAGALAAGFVLAGAKVAGGALPLSVCLAAALGLGLPSFGAYIGGCLGYAAFFGSDAAVEPIAVGLLVEACLCIFGEELDREHPWFAPGCVMVFSGMVGFLFLIQSRLWTRLLWRYFLKIAISGLGTYGFRRALHPSHSGSELLLPVCLTAGLCALQPVGFPLGLVAGCAMAAAAAGTPMGLMAAVLCGLALDLSWGGGCCTVVLTLAALCSGWQAGNLRRLGLWLGATVLGVLVTGSHSLLLAGAMLGAVLSPLVPTERWFEVSPQGLMTKDPRLALAAGLLEQMGQCMTFCRVDDADPETNAVFDQAAERVCRHCGLWEQCWETEIESTCEALNRAAPPMMRRGKALREDLPPAFTDRCRYLDGFLTAVNRELEDLSCRRQYRSRLRESRQVLAQQYDVLSRALGKQRSDGPATLRFQPELGFRSLSRTADGMSGDRGASFRVGKWFYLILCDGMGTGTAANAEAGAAISILRTLLQSGISPQSAMIFLNGVYILRDDGGFATVDLLQADLTTGEAELYKWGAAPSYLKRRGKVEKIGTASPPPGVGVGEEYRPEGTRLSLGKGELLVLVSDGAGGEVAEHFIRQYGGLSPKELASGVVGCSKSSGEDDRTAAVLALRPRLSV